MNQDQPIAIYREHRFDGKRLFELFPDRVRIHGHVQLHSEFDTTIPLNTLIPIPNVIRIRNKSFVHGIWMFLGAFVLDTFLIASLHVPPENFAILLIGGLGFAGLVTMLVAARRVEFVSFNGTGGLPVLDFARSGPDAANFDTFVRLVTEHISNAHGRTA